MKVILLQDVKSQGKKGDIIEVSEGYARNMLIKKKLGVEATPEALNNLKLQNRHEEKVAAENLADAQALAKEVAEWLVETKIKTGEATKEDALNEFYDTVESTFAGEIVVER